MEERVYNGYVYRRSAPDQPWQQVGPAQQQSRGRVIADPYRASEEARKNEDQQFQRQQLGLGEDAAARARSKEAIDNPQALRKEYAALPEVKEYKVAAQMASQGLGTAANPQGDIALTYAFAKAMDPGSVVRDQEANMVTNSQPWFQSAVENAKKQFGMDGAGNFTPEARARIRQEIVRAVASRKPLYDQARAEMGEIAVANGIAPAQVIGKDVIEAYAPSFRSYAEKHGDEGNIISSLLGTGPIARGQETQRAAPMGSTEQAIPIPPEMQQAHDQYLSANWGKLDPKDYAAFRINLDRQYGFGSDPDGYAANAAELNKAAAQGQGLQGQFIPSVKQELSGFDKFRNDALSNPIGAGVASGLNSATFGVPSLFAPEQTQALREEYPVSTFAGDIGGGLVGTGLAGAGLRKVASSVTNPSVAQILANPLAADMAYGATYGATQADDPLYGAVGGATSAFLGNRFGSAVGRAFPAVTGMGGAIRRADESVPTSQQLREQASLLYDAAEATGEVIGPDETFALNDRLSQVLSQEGRLSPTGRVTEVMPRVKEAFQLTGDYAGEQMTPKQVQTIRRVMGDAVTTGESDERRIARLLLGEFDDWTDSAAPELASGLAEARGVAQRYIQGDEIELARNLADVRAGQFSNGGRGNALRTDFRQLDRAIEKGQQSFSPEVESAVRDVARGTPMGNALRSVGRFAPTSAFSSLPTIAAAGGGSAALGPAGLLGGALVAVPTFAARELGQRLTDRSAQVAQNLAYGGPEYSAVLSALLEDSATRGGHGGAVTTTELARLIADSTGY